MNVVIRRALEGDLEAILAIARDSRPAPQWSFEEWGAILEASRSDSGLMREVLVAERGGVVAGFAVYTLLRAVFPPDAELESLAVGPAFRRMGLATALLQAIVGEIATAGAKELVLEVRAGNVDAIALYRYAGFKPAGIRKGYYTSPREDAVFMQLPLPKPSSQKSNDLLV